MGEEPGRNNGAKNAAVKKQAWDLIKLRQKKRALLIFRSYSTLFVKNSLKLNVFGLCF